MRTHGPAYLAPLTRRELNMTRDYIARVRVVGEEDNTHRRVFDHVGDHCDLVDVPGIVGLGLYLPVQILYPFDVIVTVDAIAPAGVPGVLPGQRERIATTRLVRYPESAAPPRAG